MGGRNPHFHFLDLKASDANDYRLNDPSGLKAYRSSPETFLRASICSDGTRAAFKSIVGPGYSCLHARLALRISSAWGPRVGIEPGVDQGVSPPVRNGS